MHKPSTVGTIVAGLIFAAVAFVGSRPVGSVPALGPILDPANGIWNVVASAELPATLSANVRGLSADTRVEYDDRAVPHIFARSIADAYRALGYVVARDRLFQLELSARAGGGTLTELVGSRALPVDRDTRASGMPASAEDRVAKLDHHSAAYLLAVSYVDGVNSYIASLMPRDYPMEYKLLGRAPKQMEIIDIFHLLNRMGATLATSDDEVTHLEASARIGRIAADALFPIHAPIVEPIQPNGDRSARFDDTRLPPPGLPDSAAVAMTRLLPVSARTQITAFAPTRSDDAIGSNNWAVAPSRSKSGHAILAGDPHLELTLPSIWYEAHLVVPDSLDVYGVTIPGAPGIVIGFTQAVAWTFTNTGADVMDYYVETVDNQNSPTRYRFDGNMKPLRVRVQAYRAPNGTTIAIDTLRFTHRGPLRRVGDKWVSVRWTVLESMRILEGFDAASHAPSSRSLLDSMGQLYDAPAQNMLTVDTSGAIGIQSTGKFPIRPTDGRGDVLRDGRTRGSDWTGYWPASDYPQSDNPMQGFLASANQEPIDPRVQPRYLGANWERPWRAIRINTLLRQDSAVTPDAMRRYQTDPGSARADFFVPRLLDIARSFAAANTSDGRIHRLTRTAQLLSEWDRTYARDNRRAVLFEEIMRMTSLKLWDELRTESSGNPIPSDMMIAMLMSDSLSPWWDDRSTPSTEHRDALLVDAMIAALDTVISARGEPSDHRWQWDQVRFANIEHVLGLPAFSRRNIPVPGGSATLWPSTGNGRHGPSWRMVVEMSTPRQAWATYPGGQSGNPVSTRYDDHIRSWRDGLLDTLRLPTTPGQLPPSQRRATLTLVPAGATK